MTLHEPPIRVLLVQEHEHVLWGLRKLVEGEWPRMVVVGTARTLREALCALRKRNCDVTVIDLALGEGSLEPLLEVHGLGAPFLVLTGTRDPDLHRRALACGAQAVVQNEEPAAVLLRAIESAHQRTREASHEQ